MTRNDIRVSFYTLALELVRAFSRTYPHTQRFAVGALEWGPTANWPPGTFLARRAYGQCSWDPETRTARVRLASKTTSAPSEVIRGVILHELGHAALFARGGLGHRYGDLQETAEQRHAAERAADAEAERLFDTRIYYDPELVVQRTESGLRPRPIELDELLTRAAAELPVQRGNPASYSCGCTG